MGIKKYYASKDNTITNAFKANLIDRGTTANMGAADILEAFVIHGQTSASVTPTPSAQNALNAEQTRFLIQFPIDEIAADITASVLPSSTGSISFYLNLYNAPHGSTLPVSFSLGAHVVSREWDEGRGLDMDNYTNIGQSSWVSASTTTAWTKPGGDVLTGPNTSGTISFPTGLENIRFDVSQFVYNWLDGTDNYGLLLRFPDSAVSGSDSLYTKKFFSRTSEFFHYRPTLEARWDSARKDNRASFYISSSVASGEDNLNTLYLYNRIRGTLKNIPTLNNNKLAVSVYSGSEGTPSGNPLSLVDADGTSKTVITGGLLVENGAAVTGIYTASFASTSTLTEVYDVWHTGSGASLVNFKTGSYQPLSWDTATTVDETSYITTITNLKSEYPQGEVPSLRVFVRNKNWSPNIYTVATSETKPTIIEQAYYRVYRVIDDLNVIPYGTGSSNNNYSQLSYDGEGNYFSLDTSCLEPGYSYGIKFAFYQEGSYVEQPSVFKFRIEDDTQ